MTVSCVSLQSKPFSFSSSQYGRADSVNSTPINKPFPRMSLISGLLIFFNSSIIYVPNSKERSTSFSSSMTSSAAMETAQANGFPPNVDPCEPGLNTPRISLFATMHEIGNTPPPRAFPSIKYLVIHLPSHRQTFSQFGQVQLEFHLPCRVHCLLGRHHRLLLESLLEA